MPRKKIVFVIVEGPSDDEALGVILNRIYDRNTVHVHIMHSDITSETGVNPSNIVARIGDLVKSYAKNNSFRKTDFCRIIQITDTDGAFVPDENITEDLSYKKAFYSTNEIRTCNKAGIEDRNRRKAENLNRLVATSAIWSIPYSIYYMSCNLDHAMYGKLNCTDIEKEQEALYFAKRFKDDIPEFLRFISESDFSVADDYSGSWKFIRIGLHSLERHTNFGLCFQKSKSSDDG